MKIPKVLSVPLNTVGKLVVDAHQAYQKLK